MARLTALRAKRSITPTPAIVDVDLLWIGTHHKMMTTYFTAVIRLFAFGMDLRYDDVPYHASPTDAQLVVATHSTLDLEAIGRYRGVHVFRDPCEAIISAYHYHKWTHEIWANTPDESGETYRQKINRLPKRDGLLCEIDRFLLSYEDLCRDWDLADPNVLELRFEDLMGPDRVAEYARVFAHLGFDEEETGLGVELMSAFEAANRTGRQDPGSHAHVRATSNASRRSEFDADHFAYMERRMGDIVRKFGYELPAAEERAA